MNRAFGIIAICICSNLSFGQIKEDPFSIPLLINSTLLEHKDIWNSAGYQLVRTNYDGCILTYELKDKGQNTFVDFTEGWRTVEEVILTFNTPEKYNMYMNYAIDNFSEEKTDGVSRFFVYPKFLALIGFSIREYAIGKIYMIRITPI